jgi:RNA polymerase sigma-70 factor, ECF subfamily
MPIAVGELSQFGESVGRRDVVRHLNREEQLIQDAQNGDARAFNELVCEHQARAYRLAYRILGDADMASDAIQEAFISAYQHLRAFRGGSLNAWLMRIVANACYDQLRKKQRQQTYSLDVLLVDPDQRAPRLEQAIPESPQELAERHELNNVIQQGLAELPFDQRVTLVLTDIEGYTYEQVAEITEANLGTVKSRLARGRGALRAFFLSDEGLLPAKYRHGRA